MKKQSECKKLIIPFCWGLVAVIFFPMASPSLNLSFFTAPLAFAYMHTTLAASLSLAVLSGLVMDSMTTSFPFGVHALILFVCTLFLYRFRQQFFKEKPFSLGVYSAFTSLCMTILTFLVNILLERALPFTWRGIISDFMIMPIIDGLFAIFWFSLPKILIRIGKRQFEKIASRK